MLKFMSETHVQLQLQSVDLLAGLVELLQLLLQTHRYPLTPPDTDIPPRARSIPTDASRGPAWIRGSNSSSCLPDSSSSLSALLPAPSGFSPGFSISSWSLLAHQPTGVSRAPLKALRGPVARGILVAANLRKQPRHHFTCLPRKKHFIFLTACCVYGYGCTENPVRTGYIPERLFGSTWDVGLKRVKPTYPHENKD